MNTEKIGNRKRQMRGEVMQAGYGFSLLELLVVILVISLFTGISVSGVSGLRQLMAERESWIRFTELTQAVRMFELERGHWPDWLRSGEVELAATNGSWHSSLARFYEGPFGRVAPSDGFGNERIYVIADLNGDHWIHAADFRALPQEERPERVHARVVVYSLDAQGRLAAASWK